MIYAFILLSIVAVLTWSAWSGLSIPEVHTAGIQEKVIQAYERAKDRAVTAIKNKAQEELHDAVDKAFEE